MKPDMVDQMTPPL